MVREACPKPSSEQLYSSRIGIHLGGLIILSIASFVNWVFSVIQCALEVYIMLWMCFYVLLKSCVIEKFFIPQT